MSLFKVEYEKIGEAGKKVFKFTEYIEMNDVVRISRGHMPVLGRQSSEHELTFHYINGKESKIVFNNEDEINKVMERLDELSLKES